jgi:SAM-dependent methyltransferase
MNKRLSEPAMRLLGLGLIVDSIRRTAARGSLARDAGPSRRAAEPPSRRAAPRFVVSGLPLGALELILGLATLERVPLAPRTMYRVLAPVYDQLTPVWRDWLHRDASRALDVALRASCPANGRVLDLGCGTGAVLERLVATGAPFASYTGVDQSTAMLGRAQAKHGARPGVRFEQLDLRRDPLPAGPFDLITSAWALEHLPDPGQVVASAWDRLRPGGHLVLFFEADGSSWRERALRRAWLFFGARLVPERDYAAWPGAISVRRFPGLSPSVVLAVNAGPQDAPSPEGVDRLADQSSAGDSPPT